MKTVYLQSDRVLIHHQRSSADHESPKWVLPNKLQPSNTVLNGICIWHPFPLESYDCVTSSGFTVRSVWKLVFIFSCLTSSQVLRAAFVLQWTHIWAPGALFVVLRPLEKWQRNPSSRLWHVCEWRPLPVRDPSCGAGRWMGPGLVLEALMWMSSHHWGFAVVGY